MADAQIRNESFEQGPDPMARIDPPLYEYNRHIFSLSGDARSALNKQFRVTFSESDFTDIESALSLCESVYYTRKEALDREKVSKHLRKIESTAAALQKLLDPTTGNISPPDSSPLTGKRLMVAEDAVGRIRHAMGNFELNDELTDIVDLKPNGPARVDVVPRLGSDLAFLATVSGEEAAHVEGLSTLSQGSDAAHHDMLLNQLTPVAARNKLQTTYTTFEGRRSDLVDLACMAAKFARDENGNALPAAIRPEPGGLVERLRLLRAATKPELSA